MRTLQAVECVLPAPQPSLPLKRMLQLERDSDDDGSTGAACKKTRGRNATLLAAANPYIFDARVAFDEALHEYWVDGNKVATSVTALVKRAFCDETFDAERTARRCLPAWREGRGASKYQKLVASKTDEQAITAVVNIWGDANRLGTLLHKCVELYENQRPLEAVSLAVDELKEDFDAYTRRRSDLAWQCVRTELALFYTSSAGAVVAAGQCDLLMRTEDGSLAIVDLKRTDKTLSLLPGGAIETALLPPGSAKDNNLHRYSLQNSLYAVMYEQRTGVSINQTYILQVNPSKNCTVSLTTCKDMRTEARRILEAL